MMADKQNFLEKLSAALAARNISESDIAKYIDQFDRYYEKMAADSGTAEKMLGDIEAIADNIAAKAHVAADKADMARAGTETVQTVSVDTQIIDASEVEILSAAEVDDEEQSKVLPDASNRDDAQESRTFVDGEEHTYSDGREYVYTAKQLRPIKKRTVSGGGLFWVLFFVTLPITVPIAAVILLLFAGIWAALFGVIAAAVVGLVGVVALGATASLIGIIYGIIQLFTSVPVGLYEIGIGVIIAGITMFFGILIYNFAIRLLPFIVRLVYKLFRFVQGKLKELFIYLRKECAKL